MNLSRLLTHKRDRVIARWLESVSGSLHPETMRRLELVDHLPQFLAEVAEALLALESPEVSRTAAQHGVQRLSLGFGLDGVVREYGVLREAVLETAKAEGVVVREQEHDVLVNCVITGIAGAVSEYQRQRDVELQRHMTEHFAFIAHELRNPLGSSLAAISMLERRGQLDMSERFTQVLQRGLKRMHELIDTTLRVAQLATGITLHREPITLSALLEDMDMAAAAAAEERAISLTFSVETDVELSVDRRLVQSALTNLIRNAVKFTHEGGSVTVRARRDGERALIEVEDSCGGLPPGAVRQAFAPFAQLGADRSGFGLGLAIAKQAAEAHAGAIRVQNLPGKGCIFVLELPIVPAAD